MKHSQVIPFILGGLFVASSAFAQGPLTPPGAPAPTMKTLDQVRPGIPITTLPFVISSWGHYYLTGNLITSDTNGPAITVTAGSVTIDLNGYKILNFGGQDTISATASGLTSVTIKNGSLHLGRRAVYAPLVAGVRLEQVQILSVAQTGVVLGDYARILDCEFFQNGLVGGGDGLVVGYGSRVVNSIFEGNQQHGLAMGPASIVEGCTSMGHSGAGYVLGKGSSIRNSSAQSNQIYGVFSFEGGVLENVTMMNNQAGAVVGNGTRISGCLIRDSVLNGISGDNEVMVERTTVVASGQRGIFLYNGGFVRDCIVRANQQAGILVHNGCSVLNNVVDINGAGNNEGGIAVYGGANRIEGNHVSSNADKGIYVLAAGNTVFKNSLRGNALAIDFVFGNDIGPEGPASAATSPWANITY